MLQAAEVAKCNVTLEERIGAFSGSPIGRPNIACPQCLGGIKTGTREWADMPTIARSLYYLRVVWWWFGRAFLLGFGAGALTLSVLDALLGLVEIEEGGGRIFLGLWGIVAVLVTVHIVRSSRREIRESLARTQGGT